jgi:predicted ATP-dependent endonuclease of OLD family
LYISINGVEHEIHFLGDGIQALIMLIYPLFLAKNDSWVFIEEPELHMHPGMQRLFIQTLLGDETLIEKNLTIFLTTHSNHLFDIAITNQSDISILAFQKIQENPSRFLVSSTTSGQLDILDLLEVSNSSVFMANCAIWVEGPTDRLYLRKYLNEYAKQYYPSFALHEDLEYCFFEYAGSNLSHYIFSQSAGTSIDTEEKIKAWFLANRIFLVADLDEHKGEKHAILSSQKSANFVYYPLQVREIENLLSPEFIVEFLPNIFEKWGRKSHDEWKLETEKTPLIHSAYRGEYIADYLIKIYSSLKFPKIKGDSGTLATYYKNKLAQEAELNIKWDNMSADAQDLAKALFNFILKNNPLLAKTIAKQAISRPL